MCTYKSNKQHIVASCWFECKCPKWHDRRNLFITIYQHFAHCHNLPNELDVGTIHDQHCEFFLTTHFLLIFSLLSLYLNLEVQCTAKEKNVFNHLLNHVHQWNSCKITWLLYTHAFLLLSTIIILSNEL